MRIVTWNVNSIGSRLERLIAFLKRHEPDVLCLQELKCLDEKFPFTEIEATGYHAAVFGQKTYNGVALISKKPAHNVVRSFKDGVDDPQSRMIAGTFDGVTVMSCYVPNGQEVGADKYFYKLNWLARLRRYLDREQSPNEPLVVCGDYNVAPGDLDVHDPAAWREKILCSTREREALRHVQEFGLTDSFRHLHPTESQFSWWDYRMLGFPKNHGLRIDLILSSEVMTKRLAACYVDRDERKGDKPSDHAPVIADFR